jgi:hypothetical protein
MSVTSEGSSSLQRTMDDDAADPSLAHYNDGNRAFLQALLARGTVTFEEGQKILAAIFTAQEGIIRSRDSPPSSLLTSEQTF